MPLYRRIANLFSRSKIENEIDAELRSHIEMRIDENIAAGMPRDQARRDALIRFGNPAALREKVSAADTEIVLDGIWRDIRYGVRQLRRSPGFALTAIGTLALAIMANIVVFGVLNALILKPLNVAGADRLFMIVQKPKGYISQSWPNFIDYRRLNSTFSDMSANKLFDVGFNAGSGARRCWAYEVSGSYFDMLGVQPALGRFFHTSDEHGPDSVPYVVLSDAFWRSQFQADPRVIGMKVDINKQPLQIIGIAPRSFHGTELLFWPDFWVPMINERQIEGFDFLNKRFNDPIWVLGLLKPGVTREQATANLNSIAAQLAKLYPAADDGMQARLVKPGLLGDNLGDPTKAFLTGIMLLAFLVLLAACANLASIFGARAADRGRELAVRLAIGSSRWHILRQLATEALLVSLAGGALATLCANLLLDRLSRWQPFPEFPIHAAVAPDAQIYVLAILLSLASGILPGLFPARQIWRTDMLQAMKNAAPAAIFRRLTLRDGLLVLQIALCALLLTASLVALRGMQRSLHAPLGFEPEGAVLADTDMHMAGYSDDSALRVQKQIIDAAMRIPGITAAGVINETPLGTGGSSTPVYRQSATTLRPTDSPFSAKFFAISPGYLQAAKSRLLRGRDFNWHDDAKTPKVALVNETFARMMFQNSSAIGRYFKLPGNTLYQIVGVLENGKYDTLPEEPAPAIFLPIAQNPDSDTTLIVRSQLPPSELAPQLNRMLSGIDPSLPFTIRSWPDALRLLLFPARAATISLGVMGLLAAMLAVTGVFGIAAYSVSRRMKELGIRIALGARRAQLMHSALARPVALLVCGSAAGLITGVVASSLLAQIVYATTPRDPFVLCGVVLVMLLIGIVATWIPAKRALAIDPATLLKDA